MKTESLSALVDGEVVTDSEALLYQLLSDSACQQQWRHYHLIRDALRGHLTTQLPADFAARVSDTLGKRSTSHAIDTNALKLTAFGSNRQRWWSAVAPWLDQLGEIGMAAGVALVVLYGAHWYSNQSDMQSSEGPRINTLPLGGRTAPACYGLARESGIEAPQPTSPQEPLPTAPQGFQTPYVQRQSSNPVGASSSLEVVAQEKMPTSSSSPEVVGQRGKKETCPWRAGWLPPGVEETFSCEQLSQNSEPRTASSLFPSRLSSKFYSDGLRMFALYVSPDANGDKRGTITMSQEQFTIYSEIRGGRKITVVGELSLGAAKRVVQQVVFADKK